MLRIRRPWRAASSKTTESEAIELSGSWRARSLLAWLAVHPGTHPRSSVAPLFWPDVLDYSARASLRNALWSIRKALGDDADSLIATRDRVGLDRVTRTSGLMPSPSTSTSARAGSNRSPRPGRAANPLAGLDDEWVYEFRDEHRERLSEPAGEACGPGRVRGLAEHRLVAPKGVPRSARRGRSACSHLATDHERATAPARSPSYGRFRQRLRDRARHLPFARDPRPRPRAAGGPPCRARTQPRSSAPPVTDSGETMDARQRTSLCPPAFATQPRRASSAAGAELEQLARALERRAQGKAGTRLARLTGEAGIGKSRLATGACARRRAPKARSSSSGLGDEDRLVPHQIWAEALEHLRSELGDAELLRRLGARSADIDPVAAAPRAATLTRTRTTGRSRRESHVPPVRSGWRAARKPSRMTRRSSLSPTTSTGRTNPTVALLRHVLERRHDTRLLIVATQRSEVDPRRALWPRRYPGSLARSFASEARSCRPARAGGRRAHRRRLSDGELSDGLVTARSPVSRRETPSSSESSSATWTSQEEERGVLSLTQAEVPERVREVVNLRLARLSDPALRLLSVAAVIGNEFDLSLLEDVASSPGRRGACAARGRHRRASDLRARLRRPRRLRVLPCPPAPNPLAAFASRFAPTGPRPRCRGARGRPRRRGAPRDRPPHVRSAQRGRPRTSPRLRDPSRRARDRRPRIRGGRGPLHPRARPASRRRPAPANARAQTGRRLPGALPRRL